MKLESDKKLKTSLHEDGKNGFVFKIYHTRRRGYRYIVEISGFKHLANGGIAGFSYQCCNLRQRQLQRIEKVLRSDRSLKVHAERL